MKITFKPFDWKRYDDPADEPDRRFHIEAYAHNRESEAVLIRIEDMTPFCYFELPDRPWSEYEVTLIHNHFKNKMGDTAPLRCNLVYRKRLYFYRERKKFPLLLMSFKTEDAMRHASNICKYPIRLDNDTQLYLTPREQDVGTIKKLLAMRKCSYVGWLQAEAREVPAAERISAEKGFAHEYYIEWRTLEPVPEAECSLWSVNPLIMSWDIEVNSFNPKVFPNPLNVRDELMMIGVTVQRLNQPETRRKLVLAYGPQFTLPDAEVRCFDTELGLIHAFCHLIIEVNPCILVGYNIIGFDYNYVNRRLMNVLEEWLPCTRVANRKPELRQLSWQSSAYGTQNLVYLHFDGRISIDLLPIIRRDYKLDRYTLDHVSKHFLNKTKVPLEYTDMFRYFSIAHRYCWPALKAACQGDRIAPFLDELRLHNEQAVAEVVAAFQQHEQPAEREAAVLALYERYRPDVMREVGVYGAEDTVLPIELFEHLNSWVNLSELAQIVKTTTMDTFTRGQQVRVFSQLYDFIYQQGYYVDKRGDVDLKLVGAYVHHPDPGIYEDVISFDFASLYPSIIQAYNLCYTTLVTDESVPDEMCNVIEWDEEGEQEAVVFNDEGQAEEGQVSANGHHRYRFIKAEHLKGIFPQFLEELLSRRKATRALMKDLVEYSAGWTILNARQNSLKVSANSGYGFLGIRKRGVLPLIEAAMCVTALGRLNIHKIMDKVLQKGGVQVYGDTDSCFCRFPGVPRDELYEFGVNMARELSRELPPPMKLEFERAYATMFILTAKRYGCVKLLPSGQPQLNIKDLYTKGIILARRDGCQLLRDVYLQVLLCILYNKGFDVAVELVMDFVIRLMSHSVELSKLIIINEVNSVYKSETNKMALFVKRLKAQGKPVAAGERVGYVYCKSEEALQGFKMTLPEQVREQPDKYRLDYLYYLEKTLLKPIQQLLQIAYHARSDFMKRIYRRVQLKQLVNEQLLAIGQRVRRVRLVVAR